MSYDSNESRMAEALDRIDSNLADLLAVIKDMAAEAKAQRPPAEAITPEQFAAKLAAWLETVPSAPTPASDNSPPRLAPSEQLAEMVTALQYIADNSGEMSKTRARLALARCGLGYEHNLALYEYDFAEYETRQ